MFNVAIVMKHPATSNTHDIAGVEICIYTSAADRKWLPVGLGGAGAGVAAGNEPLLSI